MVKRRWIRRGLGSRKSSRLSSRGGKYRNGSREPTIEPARAEGQHGKIKSRAGAESTMKQVVKEGKKKLQSEERRARAGMGWASLKWHLSSTTLAVQV